MARGVNKAIIVGNLGQDPEVRQLPSGGTVTNCSVATADSWKDKQTGERQERTEWHRVVFFNRLAEIAGEYLRKGSQVYIEGRIQTRKWQDAEGRDRYSTEIVANEMQMLGGRGDGSRENAPQARQEPRNGGGYGEAKGRPQTGAQEPQNRPEQRGGGDEFDDDIPF